MKDGGVKVNIVTGRNKETKKEWKGISVNIGKWKTLIFPKTQFEMEYIEEILNDQE